MTRASLLIVALLIAGCMSPAEETAAATARAKQARAWCDTMGIRITGAQCSGYTIECDVAPESGAPFRLWCDARRCYLPAPPSK